MAIELKSGQNISTALATDTHVLLERGGVYQTFSISKSNVRIEAYGDTSKPKPKVLGRINDVNGRNNIYIKDVDFDVQNADTAGLKFFNCNNITLDGVLVRVAGGMGVTNECYGNDATGKPKRSYGFIIKNCIIEDNWNKGTGHVSGTFISYTDGIQIINNVYNTNGWKPGSSNATIYNHNIYIHASCGPATVEGNLFHNGSSHGIQMRSGGTCRFNLFVDNAIHQSYGLVNGSPCFPGGVSGVIENNVYIGGKDIAGAKRGWCLELSQIKKVIVRNLLMAHDNQNYAKALQTQECKRVENPSGIIDPEDWDLTIQNVYVWDWPPGAYVFAAGEPKTSNVGVKPPVQANLREVIGDFLTRAKKDPVNIKRMIAECFEAAKVPLDGGIIIDPPPVVIKPATPQNFKLVEDGTKLKFTWDKVPTTGATYKVYHNNTFLTNSSDETAFGEKLPGIYHVVSVLANIHSDKSNTASYKEEIPKPAAPDVLSVVPVDNKLEVKWSKVPHDHYNVYRNGTKVGASTDETYYHPELTETIFQVSAVVNNVESDLSEAFFYKPVVPVEPKITSVTVKYDKAPDRVFDDKPIEKVTLHYEDGTEYEVK